jgi:hypothetical protein
MSDAERDLNQDPQPFDPTRYPTKHVVAILDDAKDTEEAVEELTSRGFLEKEIKIGSGTDLADRMSETTGRSGLAGMAMRINEALGLVNNEAEAKQRYEQAMRDGHYVVAVLAPTDERKEQALNILSSHSAHDIGYFGRLSIETHKPDSR